MKETVKQIEAFACAADNVSKCLHKQEAAFQLTVVSNYCCCYCAELTNHKKTEVSRTHIRVPVTQNEPLESIFTPIFFCN